MTDTYTTCGCRGTAHDPNCWVWGAAGRNKSVPPPSYAVHVEQGIDPALHRKLDRIIELLEELTGHRR